MLEAVVANNTILIKDKSRLQFDDPQAIITAFEEFLANNAEYQTTGLDQFIANFNAWFVNFEKDVNKKLDIQACLANRAISCTGASLALGIWFEKTTGRKPLYLVELSGYNDHASRYDHTIVFLPDNLLDPTVTNSAGKILIGSYDLPSGRLVEFLNKRGLGYTNIPVGRHMRYFGNLDYVCQRVGCLHNL